MKYNIRNSIIRWQISVFIDVLSDHFAPDTDTTTKVISTYANWKPVSIFLIVDNINVYPICHQLQNILSEMCMTLILAVRMGQG